MSDIGETADRAGALPNLIIIGAAKCATTSLHNYLALHPEASMSEPKELEFFSDPAIWAKGLPWYETHFDAAAAIRGESSTAYTRFDNPTFVAERIKGVVAEPKLIYMVRNPIERIRSDYHQHRTAGVESRSLAEALGDPDNSYFLASRYATQLTPFAEQFGMDSILVETQERFLVERRECLRRVFRFLEIDDTFDRPEFDLTWERSEGKGWAYSLAWKLRKRGIRPPRFLRWPMQQLARSRALGGSGSSARPPEIDGALRDSLVERLRPEAEELEAMTGMSFDGWLR
jgi:hypothetical protein